MNLDLNVAIQLAYALGIGVLTGLERSFGTLAERGEVVSVNSPPPGEEADKPTLEDVEISDSAGVRTFTVLSLLGYVGALVGEELAFVAPLVIAAATILVAALYLRSTHQGLGITTEVAALCVCCLGMLCRVNHNIAAVVGLVLTVVLASKRTTHALVRKVRRVEPTRGTSSWQIAGTPCCTPSRACTSRTCSSGSSERSSSRIMPSR